MTSPLLWIVVCLLLFSLILYFVYAARRIIKQFYRPAVIASDKTPADYELMWMDVVLTDADQRGITKGWFVPAEGQGRKPALLLQHGWCAHAAAWLPLIRTLHQAGYSVLALHGREFNGHAPCGLITIKDYRDSILLGLEWLAKQPGIQPHAITLAGHSLGGVASLLVGTLSHIPTAIIAFSAYALARSPIEKSILSLGIPFMPVGWLIVKWVEWKCDFTYQSADAIKTAAACTCPILLINGERDQLVPKHEQAIIASTITSKQCQYLILDGLGHNLPPRAQAYEKELLAFLDSRQVEQ